MVIYLSLFLSYLLFLIYLFFRIHNFKCTDKLSYYVKDLPLLKHVHCNVKNYVFSQ